MVKVIIIDEGRHLVQVHEAMPDDSYEIDAGSQVLCIDDYGSVKSYEPYDTANILQVQDEFAPCEDCDKSVLERDYRPRRAQCKHCEHEQQSFGYRFHLTMEQAAVLRQLAKDAIGTHEAGGEVYSDGEIATIKSALDRIGRDDGSAEDDRI